MGEYKVPQNVEAEDKILGPLSMKQFIYALIGIGWGAITYLILQKVIFIWIIIGVPPAVALLALGLYQKEDQPLETYVLAVIQFFTRPKVRLWQKEPIAEVFRLTPPPPKPEPLQRDQQLVHSQLQQLSYLVDTRGWATKEPSIQEPSSEVPVVDLQGRIGAEALGQEQVFVAPGSVTSNDDMLSNQTPAAQDLNLLIQNTVQSVREEAVTKMKNGPSPATAANTPSTSGSTPGPSGAIVKLATEGGDLTVAQIAAQARKTMPTEGPR